MVKVFTLVPRRPDITEEQFHEHWVGPHAELASQPSARRRSVESHRLALALGGLPPAIYDGIAEIWIDDVATAVAMAEGRGGRVHGEERRFVDVDRLACVLTDEHVLRGAPPIAREPSGVKAILLLRHAPGLSPDQFGERVEDAGRRIAALLPEARGATVAVARAEGSAGGVPPVADAVLDLSFAGVGELEGAWGRTGGEALAALRTVIDAPRSSGLVADELRVVWPEAAAITA